MEWQTNVMANKEKKMMDQMEKYRKKERRAKEIYEMVRWMN